VGEVLAEGLNDDQVFDLVKRIVDYYKASGTKLRLGSFIDQTGFENFKREVLNP
jgi:dissimilatory sulfite reductase (desulfoviridin) alpha/beta subunit